MRNIKAKEVVVQSQHVVLESAKKKRKRNRKKKVQTTVPPVVKRRRRRARKSAEMKAAARPYHLAKTVEQLLAPESTEAILEDLNSGVLVNTTSRGRKSHNLSILRSKNIHFNDNELGWYFKYLDPAGSVESGRAIGEHAKIPDGLCKFSIDAEMRMIDIFHPPVEPTGDLATATWGLNIIKFPFFRTGLIVLASSDSSEPGNDVLFELCDFLNNLEDPDDWLRNAAWRPLFNTGDNKWFVQVTRMPPNYDLADPNVGILQTVEAARISYMSITVEDNSPNLLNQGFSIHGNFLTSRELHAVQVPGILARQTMWLECHITGGSTATVSIPKLLATNPINVTVPNGSFGQIVQSPSPHFSWNFSGMALAGNYSGDYVPVPGEVWYNDGLIWATSSDTITITVILVAASQFQFQLSSSRAGTVSFTENVVAGAVVSVEMQASLPDPSQINEVSATRIGLPASDVTQMASNNPKISQVLLKESMGAYVVAQKFRKPVFELTSISERGPVQFDYPGYDQHRNHDDGTGLVDIVDGNFGVISVALRGISFANVPVVKTYVGWEGVVNVNSPFGQLAHAGLPPNPALLSVVDSLNTELTGSYKASENTAAAVSHLASRCLKLIPLASANASFLAGLAADVVGAFM